MIKRLVSWRSAFGGGGVCVALSKLNGDKVSTLDGFTMAFWKFSLRFVKSKE